MTLATSTGVQLHIEDALAAGDRVWLRGRLVRPGTGSGWWRFGRETAPVSPPHLQVRVSGQTLESDLDVRPDGRFDVLLHANLPAARRGWRVARHRVTWNQQHAEACALILTPPADADEAFVVRLPDEFANKNGGPQRLSDSEAGARFARSLLSIEPARRGRNPFLYVACAPRGQAAGMNELGLALTARGCPNGHLLLLEGDHSNEQIGEAIDRLRWLYAGTLPMCLVNGHGTATPEAPDRAPMRSLNGIKANGTNGTQAGRRSSLVPHAPVVFCHGMLAFSMIKMAIPEDPNCFTPLRTFLAERGVHAFYPAVAPTSGVVHRAEQLRDQIRSWTDQPVNIIAHSMGGLDARWMIAHLGMGDRVRTLTTVSTPHRGTHLAEWFALNFRQRVPLLFTLEAFGVNVDGFRDLARDVCADFNASTPDDSRVRYFSFAGDVPVALVSPALRRGHNILTPIEGPNDGMVSVRSARWGEFLGTVMADHFAQTPDGAFVRPGEDFDTLGFYSRIIEDLARRGY